ncbi:MAG: DNA-directed RNA polymerase subunit omega [Bacteroidia bacterium]
MKENNFLPLDVKRMGELGGNVYRALIIASKRANQITLDLKEELAGKLSEFAPAYDNLEEVMENKEQIEISRFYERKPKPTQTALEEFMRKKIPYRDPLDDIE